MANSSPAKKSGWGSVFSNAVAGLESRLDTILAEDPDASSRVRLSDIAEAKERAEQEAEEERRNRNLSPPPTTAATKDSRARANDRLAEKLARITAAKAGGSASRTESPAAVLREDGRASGEESRSSDVVRKVVEVDETSAASVSGEIPGTSESTAETKGEPEDLAKTTVVEDAARVSTESTTRPSTEVKPADVSTTSPRASTDLPNGNTAHKLPTDTDAELTRMREERLQHQEEMHMYLEKIDALQTKLTYLAQQTVAAAKEANNAASASTDDEAKLAEKDEKIAELMQEGEKLSKAEFRHLQTIKKLRVKGAEDEKAAAETKKKVERAEQNERELKLKLKKTEVAERQAQDKAKQISVIEKQVDELKIDRENASELVRSLTVQLKEAKEATTKAEREAKEKATSEADKSRIATLQNELEDAQIERKLAESRTEADTKQLKEGFEGERQRFGVRELELKNEISILESRVEAIRARAEETESAGGSVGGASAAGGEANAVKLLRQVETLQSQYALAKENWESIEGSLQARLVALERERDESSRREGEARKKVREFGGKAKRAEEEVESLGDRVVRLEGELSGKEEEVRELSERCEGAEKMAAEARGQFEREKKGWEEERSKWQRSGSGSAGSAFVAPAQSHQQQRDASRNGSPVPPATATFSHSRKTSQTNLDSLRRPNNPRLVSNDLTALRTENLAAQQLQQQRTSSRRSSSYFPVQTPGTTNAARTFSPTPPPGLTRQESLFSLDPNTGMPPTPSIEIENLQDDGGFEMSETPIGMNNSPDRTINDIVSTSTTPAAGPSVQLVERMSATVRRLESEKAAAKDELARLTTQRDSARDEVVSLMREVDVKRNTEGKVGVLEKEMKELNGRYEASLEMLGEREEEVEELRADVRELKRLYRELVDEKMRLPGGG